MTREKKIKNALKRSEVHRKTKREREQAKLARRMEIKKAEKDKVNGAALRAERLAKNVPKTLDNTRQFDATSYLTADPQTLRDLEEKAARASRMINGEEPEEDDSEDDEDGDEDEAGDSDEDEEMPEAGPSRPKKAQPAARRAEGANDEEGDEEEDGEGAEEGSEQTPEGSEQIDPNQVVLPPKIMITTSPSPCKLTYQFCDDLKNVFPGGEFFKRPRGRGFEIGRVARWAGKRGFGALIVVNEDHKTPNAITLINLPAGPTAYFKLSSVVPSSAIYGHARPTPHSPELILNNFTTLLGNSVGRLFGSLFPPLPQFRGRQVVTLHNQRDFLFFRRHRYMFASATSAKLQEIGPRFTLKLRWLRKGLPAVTAPDGRAPAGENDDDIDFSSDEEGDKKDEDEAMEEMNGSGEPVKKGKGKEKGIKVPKLDEEQECEWKWKPKMEVSRRTFFL
ncbi:ribosome production factor 1 [Kwoniella heveanensis BCC8398]|uniref:Ribosome production factor 1 n=1 Tax=Kwoniella heveanensis BCC8398 TaxID=1296120 RepID=A0A1B9GYC0_9TREE|nr:ribosome production factor 1 [Kwoniella heveanensis BCC8398]